MNDHHLFAELERLAAAFPWQSVDIWLRREPAGEVKYTAYIHANEAVGIRSDSSTADTPQAAVDRIISDNQHNSPEEARTKKIAELQEQIRKLQSVEIGLPPYIPNRELAAHNLNPIEV
jgi:hypothetical protein